MDQESMENAAEAVKQVDAKPPDMAEMMGRAQAVMGAVPRAPMAPPTLPAGPDIEAIKAAAGPKASVAQMPNPSQAPKRVRGPGMMSDKVQIRLDPVIMLKIELAFTKQALAQKDEELAIMALREARAKGVAAKREEAQIREQISQQVGYPVTGDIQLVDRDRGICQFSAPPLPTEERAAVESKSQEKK